MGKRTTVEGCDHSCSPGEFFTYDVGDSEDCNDWDTGHGFAGGGVTTKGTCSACDTGYYQSENAHREVCKSQLSCPDGYTISGDNTQYGTCIATSTTTTTAVTTITTITSSTTTATTATVTTVLGTMTFTSNVTAKTTTSKPTTAATTLAKSSTTTATASTIAAATKIPAKQGGDNNIDDPAGNPPQSSGGGGGCSVGQADPPDCDLFTEEACGTILEVHPQPSALQRAVHDSQPSSRSTISATEAGVVYAIPVDLQDDEGSSGNTDSNGYAMPLANYAVVGTGSSATTNGGGGGGNHEYSIPEARSRAAPLLPLDLDGYVVDDTAHAEAGAAPGGVVFTDASDCDGPDYFRRANTKLPYLQLRTPGAIGTIANVLVLCSWLVGMGKRTTAQECYHSCSQGQFFTYDWGDSEDCNDGDTGYCTTCLENTYQDRSSHTQLKCTEQPLCSQGHGFVGGGVTTKGTCSACDTGYYQSENAHREVCKSQLSCPDGYTISGDNTQYGTCIATSTTTTTAVTTITTITSSTTTATTATNNGGGQENTGASQPNGSSDTDDNIENDITDGSMPGGKLAAIVVAILVVATSVFISVIVWCRRKQAAGPMSEEEFPERTPTVDMQTNPLFNRKAARHRSTTDSNNVYDAGNPPKRSARAQGGSNSASGSALQPRPLMLRPSTASEQHADAAAAATAAGGGGGGGAVDKESNATAGSASIGDNGDVSGRMPSNINYSGYDPVQQVAQGEIVYAIPSEV
eukprot:gene10421-13576_t